MIKDKVTPKSTDSAYRLLNMWTDAYEELEQAEQEESDQLVQECRDFMADLELATSDKIERMAFVIQRLKGEGATLKGEAKRLTTRANARENAMRRVRDMLRDLMIESGIDKNKGLRYSVSVSAGRSSVVVVDPDLVPTEYRTPQPDKISKKDIAKQYKAGKFVPGTTLELGEPSLTIR